MPHCRLTDQPRCGTDYVSLWLPYSSNHGRGAPSGGGVIVATIRPGSESSGSIRLAVLHTYIGTIHDRSCALRSTHCGCPPDRPAELCLSGGSTPGLCWVGAGRGPDHLHTSVIMDLCAKSAVYPWQLTSRSAEETMPTKPPERQRMKTGRGRLVC